MAVFKEVCFRTGLSRRRITLCEFSLWTMCLFVCLQIVSIDGIDSEVSCAAVKNTFESKGLLSVIDIQSQPTSDGGGLCAGGSGGCCGPATRLASTARSQLDSTVRVAVDKLAAVLAGRARKFDEFFKDLLAQSKREFHEMFKRTYGMIYERHSYVFTGLFTELERYYAKGDVDLANVMEHFFNVLYQKMFTVLNSQYNFDDKYLVCVGEHMKELQPFGDVPHKLSVQLRRAFVATRTFHRALKAGADVAASMNQVWVSAECGRSMGRARWCGACAGRPELPCSRLCINVARGCLHAHADISPDWDAYVDAVDKVADRLLGPFNIAMVVEPIDIKISEAIMNFQEHANEISQKIFTGCGKPVLGQVPAANPTTTQSGGGFGTPKRDRRSLHRYISNDLQNRNDNVDDFEIETSYESLIDKNPFLVKSKNSELPSEDAYDFDIMEEMVEKAAMRDRFLKYMRGQMDSMDSEEGVEDKRQKREANPKVGSKEIDFEPYNFGGNQGGAKKKGKKQGAGKKQGSDVSGEGGAGGASLERLVREARSRVKDSRQYWSHLPYLVCDERTAAPLTADQRCFNGTHVASYTLALAGEGSAALATNPSVRGGSGADAVEAPAVPAAQATLRSLTAHLKNAFNGFDVHWTDQAADDSANLIYGSGSGDGEAGGEDDDLEIVGREGSGAGGVSRHEDIDDDDEDSPPPDMEDDLDAGSGHSPTRIDEERVEPVTPDTDLDHESPEMTDDFSPSVVEADQGSKHTVHVEGESGGDPKPPVAPSRPASAGTAHQSMSLQRALFTYLFPIVFAWFGGIVTDVL